MITALYLLILCKLSLIFLLINWSLSSLIYKLSDSSNWYHWFYRTRTVLSCLLRSENHKGSRVLLAGGLWQVEEARHAVLLEQTLNLSQCISFLQIKRFVFSSLSLHSVVMPILQISYHYVEITWVCLPVFYSYRGLLKKPCLFQYIPDPQDFFKPLYHTYQGDFKVREQSDCILNILWQCTFLIPPLVNQRETMCVSEGILCVKYSIRLTTCKWWFKWVSHTGASKNTGRSSVLTSGWT